MIPSDPSTLLDEDLREAESSIFKDDELDVYPYSLDFTDPGTPSLGDIPSPSALHFNEPKLGSLYVEGPLMPQSLSPGPSDSNIDLRGLSEGVQIDQPIDTLKARGEQDPDGIFSDDILSSLEGQSKSLVRTVEQERLQASDAEARIPIPVLDFAVPEPEWQQVPLELSSQWNLVLKACIVSKVPPWTRTSIPDGKLRWVPFPEELAYVSLEETIEDDGTLESFLDCIDPLGIPTSADYVWKQPGLAILLQEPDDEWDELQPSEQETSDDLDSIVRKRRADLNIDRSSGTTPPANSTPQKSMELPTTMAMNRPGKMASLLVGDDDASATATLLSNFIDFHTAKRQKHTKSSFFPVSESPPDNTETIVTKTPVPVKCQTRPNTPPAEVSLMDTTPAPCPPLVIPALPATIIKALSLSRRIFSRLTQLHPGVRIIERDFDRWNTVAWERNSISRSPVVSSLAAEADIIVSPATGIVLTTLLKAIQKPPPGHKGSAAIRERLSSVSLRYERLIVLVSEGNRLDETVRDLSSSECEAYADFSGFVSGLNTNGQTYYIGGGDDTLANWLVSFIVRHSQEAAEIQNMLISEESLWELFLRRAGMNAYAAQAIPALMKAPDEASDEELDSQYGLPQFIKMTSTERVKRFRGILGGENVLARVSDLVDAYWG
ncbi:hypothetical protein SLS62_009628 [Diatrype stigma]|uniref:Uncharacterized protein n=1 Tax=Diatrype stigma TaxID=117547 RepID=A0AAN9UDF7_9PEZI